MDMSMRSDTKNDCLRQQASLNPHPEQVRAPLFLTHPFFDPRDLVQVKYEMLRQVSQEQVSVTSAAALYGFSRVTFYQVEHRFTAEGLPGLLPRLKGPRQAYKLSEAVLQRLHQILQDEPTLLEVDLQQRLQQDLGLCVHPRSIERALIRARKKVCRCKIPALHWSVPQPPCGKIMRISAARHCRRTILLWIVSSWSNKAWLPGCSSSQYRRRSFRNPAWHFRQNWFAC